LLVGVGAVQEPVADNGFSAQKYQSVFKHSQGEVAYFAAYDRTLEAWPVPYKTKYVRTAYGDTHMIISGPEDGEPLILIPGSITDATIWSGSIVAFARTYRVYALDTMGDVGKNRMVEPFPDPAGAAAWLTDVLDALEIEKAFMVGYSQGGFFTTNYALHNPERLKKIVLLAPAATLAPLGIDFILDNILPFSVAGLANNVYEAKLGGTYGVEMLGKWLLNVSKEELQEMIKDEDLAELISIFGDESVRGLRESIDSVIKSGIRSLHAPGNPVDFEKFDLMSLGIRYKDPGSMKFGPYPLPDEALQMIKTPTLLLLGDNETLYQGGPDQAIRRAEELMPNIQTVVIPDAGHAVLWEEPELVSSHILDFFSGDM
jgi:pimeloyl-ACP methyl ester carboxylesterase